MNERIKNLIAKTRTDVSGKWIAADQIETIVNQVIKDCTDAANAKRIVIIRPSETHSISYNDGLDAGISAFKDHFGVEE